MPSRRIIFVNRFFYPDKSATSQLLSDVAFHCASHDHSVVIITTRGMYDDDKTAWPATASHNGVEIFRVYRPCFGRRNLFSRSLDYVGMCLAFARAVSRIATRSDVLVVKTDPPMLSVALAPIAAHKRLALVNWLQDLYPEIALRLGFSWLKPLGPLLTALRNTALRAATRNVVISRRMRETLIEIGIAPDRVSTIENWCDDSKVTPLLAGETPLRAKWGLSGKFIVGYSGNLGRAHEFATLVDAANKLRHEQGLVFLFVGDGHQMSLLKHEVDRYGLNAMFEYRPLQDRDILSQTLNTPDVHWLSHPENMEGLALPSKLYGIAAAGRPIVAVTDPKGEIAELILRFDCGVAITPGDGDGLARAIRRFRDDPSLVVRQGNHARRMLDEHFSQRCALERWRMLIENA